MAQGIACDGVNGADDRGARKEALSALLPIFLAWSGSAGQGRAKCLCHNKRKMFHVTLFELFRAARCCCDFARSFTVALKKAVGRFKNMVGDCTRRRDNNDHFVRARVNGLDDAFKWRCVLSRVF